MRKVELSPSVLAADKTQIEKELERARNTKSKYIHLDVMDGKFVPHVTLPFEQLKYIASISGLINDVHIMVEKPFEFALKYIECGADILTFHLEACSNKEEVLKTIELIKSKGCKVGISIKPETPVEDIFEYLPLLDLVLIMSVEPGEGGRVFIPSSVQKIAKLRSFIDTNRLNTLIEVDGGINDITSKLVKEAGVDILVAGSYLFRSSDMENRAAKLLEE